MKTIFRNVTLLVLAVILVLTALPLTSSNAAALGVAATPSASGAVKDPVLVNARLELVFARQQLKVERMGRAVQNFDKQTLRVQKLLDYAKEKGLDVTAVQSAFDAYKIAFPKGKPFYEQAKELVTKHAGFDAAGKVTDLEQAKATVKNLAQAIKQHRDMVGPAFKNLRDAVKAFREANPHLKPTPATSG